MDKCDEYKDKAHEVNSEVKVLEEGIGKIFNACTLVFILRIMLKSCTYYLVLDIRATKLHNESEEEAKEDKKLMDMGTCEVSGSGSKILGKTGCVHGSFVAVSLVLKEMLIVAKAYVHYSCQQKMTRLYFYLQILKILLILLKS